MPKFRKKPVVIEAIRWAGDNVDTVLWWAEERSDAPTIAVQDGQLTISTLEGDMRAEVGDWIICGVQGEFYPCKPSIFWETYEEVSWFEEAP